MIDDTGHMAHKPVSASTGRLALPFTDQLIGRALGAWKDRLLDLSRRNRLLYYRPTKSSSLNIVQPSPDTVFDILVNRGAKLVFGHSAGIDPDDDNAQQMYLVPADSSGTYKGNTKIRPNMIMTDKQPTELRNTLRRLNQLARAALEEQGTNILYLAAGFIDCPDPRSPSDRLVAPILLIPTALSRSSVGRPWELQAIEDEVEPNPTLDHVLRTTHDISLPDPSDFEGEIQLDTYLTAVIKAIGLRPDWTIRRDIVLSLFSFQKLAMVQDLEENRKLISAHSIARALAGDTSLIEPPPNDLPRVTELDKTAPASKYHILDTDSSQQHAIEMALRGVNLIVHGPPGTGKSQTIANLIAEFLAADKRVLFVAEKSAALDVVYRRVEKAGLGPFCLKIHDIEKERVYSQLAEARSLCGSVIATVEDVASELFDVRNTANALVTALHSAQTALSITPFRVHAHLAGLAGAPLISCSLPSPSACTEEKRRKLFSLIGELSAYAQVMNNQETHPWRCSKSAVAGIAWQLRAQEEFTLAVARLKRLQSVCKTVTDLLGLPHVRSVRDARVLAGLCQFVAHLGVIQCDLEHKYDGILQLPVEELLLRFSKVYSSWWNRLPFSSYSSDVKVIRCKAKDKYSPSFPDCLNDLREATLLKAANCVIHPVTDVDWDTLERLNFGLQSDLAVINLVAVQGNSPVDVEAHLAAITRLLCEFDNFVEFLATGFDLDGLLVGGSPINTSDLGDLCKWLRDRSTSIKEASDWHGLQGAWEACRSAGLGNYVDKLLDYLKTEGPITESTIRDCFERRFWQLWLDEVYPTLPMLATFDAERHEKLLHRFRLLDQQYIGQNGMRLRSVLVSKLPQTIMNSAPPNSELALLDRELAKKRRRMPIRRLFSTVPQALMQLTPCIMMSPLAVSQVIQPDSVEFDVVIFDEASQLRTEDAVGSVYRANQIIVAGDPQQLPPTRFFTAASYCDDDLQEDDDDDSAFESLLDRCLALSMPRPLLRFHYRSRDEGLIAFSNYHFYKGELVTFPAAFDDAQQGLIFHYVPGVYDRGKSRTNRQEACEVTKLVLAHLETRPSQSLGVVALSSAQEHAIEDSLEILRREHPELECHFSPDRPEPFFVKNLERVQGDERDVMILSVGYGRDAAGNLDMRFGPLNAQGGRRRLNVAITRARHKMVVVSSIRAADLPEHTQNEGVRLLRSYLDFAERGPEALPRIDSIENEGLAESPLEDSIGEALKRRGHQVRRQVGCSGYRIDIAVVDPKDPGRYLIGIECDGATYHSSATARERDRIRQSVLESLGWRIIRVWSYEWLRDPEYQISRIESALRYSTDNHDLNSGQSTSSHPSMSTSSIEFAFECNQKVPVAQVVSHVPSKKGPPAYQKAAIKKTTASFSYASSNALRDQVMQVVVVESPVHQDTVVERIAECWHIPRLGTQMRNRITTAIASAVATGTVVREGDFLWSKSNLKQATPRGPAIDEGPRAIERVALAELATAVGMVAEMGLSTPREALLRNTANFLGYRRPRENVFQRIDKAVELALKTDRCASDGENILRGTSLRTSLDGR